MADQADMAAEIAAEAIARGVAAARVAIPAGVAGECEACGGDSPRLVGGRCAPCRDGRNRVAPIVRVAAPPAAEPEDFGEDWERVAERVRAIRAEMVRADVPPARRQETAMKARQVSFRAQGAVLEAIEAAAHAGDGVMGSAVVSLIERGMDPRRAPAAPAEPAEPVTPWARRDAIVTAIGTLVDDLLAAAQDAAEGGALKAQLDEAIGRAEAAEAKLAQLRAALA